MARIFPSLISGNLLNLQSDITLLDPLCDGYHLDVMDCHFVPNLTWGPQFINAIASVTKQTLWVHLMTTNPACVIEQLDIPQKSMVEIHIELEYKIEAILTIIKKRGWLPGLAISPETPLEKLYPFLPLCHYVTIMSVTPGFSGQQFIP